MKDHAQATGDNHRDKKKISNPHDSFFREMMSEPKVYREFLGKYLPSEVRQYIDIRTAKPSKDHFVDERLRHLYSDSLYSVRAKDGQKIGIYILVEHQSTPDFWGPFRVWRYVFAAWDEISRGMSEKDGSLPLIIPILVYNGTKPYRQSLDLRDLIAGPRPLVNRVVFGPIQLIALNEVEDHVLKEEAHLGVLFLTLKHAYDGALPYDEILIQLGKIKNQKLLRRFLLAVFRYILNTREDTDERFLKTLTEDKLSKTLGAEIMTLAEKLEQRGMQKGLQQGRQEGRYEGRLEGKQQGVITVALNLLRSGLDETFVAQNTGLSTEELRKLKLKGGLT